MSRAFALAFALAFTACGNQNPEPVPPDEPLEECPLIVACDTASQVGVEIELDGSCYRCVRTTNAPLPFAWTIVAPCSAGAIDG